MTWVKLDDGFTDHPKVVGLSDRAFRVHVRALCYCGRFSAGIGKIPLKVLKKLGASASVIREITEAHLWDISQESGDNSYYIHDFAEYHPQVDRFKKAEAGKQGGIASGQARRSKAEAECFEKGSTVLEAKRTPVPGPARPVPVLLASDEAAEAPPLSAGDAQATYIFALGGELTPLLADEFYQLATDYPQPDQANAAIRECRKRNLRPYPRHLRAVLLELFPAVPDPATHWPDGSLKDEWALLADRKQLAQEAL